VRRRCVLQAAGDCASLTEVPFAWTWNMTVSSLKNTNTRPWADSGISRVNPSGSVTGSEFSSPPLLILMSS